MVNVLSLLQAGGSRHRCLRVSAGSWSFAYCRARQKIVCNMFVVLLRYSISAAYSAGGTAVTSEQSNNTCRTGSSPSPRRRQTHSSRRPA
ncbi:hypothetical protein PoB_000570800 [Plakobranchus ocellatus]|uniref:Secreted protein n=1 Tax=Plakobranchus ocellatus TaxID=259542 RepID=A0AAV3Y9L9_9GAST|nr:hypothetical protein PoB_000570800 [Plakobranchus ocellatus]